MTPTHAEVAKIAAMTHEANAALCRAFGDDSQPAWADAPDWQRESAMDGVRFHLANPDAEPEDSHANWMRVKQAEGWVYGPAKDTDRREHPCMVPYSELPPEQRAKDHVFKAIVNRMGEGVPA